MNWLLRLFGIRDERTWPTYKCPTCGHERELAPFQNRSARDAYLNGASVEWFEEAIERELSRG